MDAGWGRNDERDAKRIEAAMDDANIERIDYFITSHYHRDHVDGLPALARRVPIGQFLDHGDSVEQDRPTGQASWDAYRSVVDGKRRTVAPGDKLSLAGVEFSFVTAGRAVPNRPLEPTGANPYCQDASPGDDLQGENASSVGYMLSLGAFQFLNLGDLTPNIQHQVACPENKIGSGRPLPDPSPRHAPVAGAHLGGQAEGGRDQQRPPQGRRPRSVRDHRADRRSRGHLDGAPGARRR